VDSGQWAILILAWILSGKSRYSVVDIVIFGGLLTQKQKAFAIRLPKITIPDVTQIFSDENANRSLAGIDSIGRLGAVPGAD